jgi:hypothetical protein
MFVVLHNWPHLHPKPIGGIIFKHEYLGAGESDVEEILKQILSELKEIKTDIGELKTGQGRLEAGQQKLQQNLIENLGT